MAHAHMPEEFFDAVAHHLPPEPPVGPKGGRPRVGHRVVIRVIGFVLTTGARWEDVPPSGVPLAIRTAGANASDHKQIIPLVLKFPEVGGKPGRPK